MYKQQSGKLPVIRSLVAILLSTALFSFSENVGGDSFAIYLNDKVLLQEHVRPGQDEKIISLRAVNVSDILKVHYSHCGKTGQRRSVAVVDSQEKVLKTWRFSDNAEMQLKVNDIVTAAKIRPARLKLVYSSNEMEKGKVLAALMLADESKASLW